MCPRLAPAKTLENQAINLLSDFKCKLDIKHPLAIPKNSSDGSTTYAFNGTQFFQIIIPSTSRDKISIFGISNLLKAAKETIGASNDVDSPRRYRGFIQEILLTPQQFKTLYERRETFIKNFEELESSRDRPRASSSLPTQKQGEPPILALFDLGGNTRS